ncbi:16S rRNA (cytidine(1402)-2'-O)-methyltransferase [Patescibacteria group bacterium]|nr:16S rRNA (cytidine(1402)-2'-O)-methyltransferase [Patescibacteria group bacterium]
MNKGTLYVVGTPIGNLEDITLRALRILKEADLIACEDTRVTKKLLGRYEIKTPVISYFQHSKPAKIDKIISELKSGKNIALVTDAGTPGVSDPGNLLVAEAVKNKIKIVPIPGPSALTSLISIAGINLQKFIFLAFPPHKKGREKFFKEVASAQYPVIYYESLHRIIKNLELLSVLTDKKIIIGRELTKMFEELFRGNIKDALLYFQNKDKLRGEFVIIIYE